MYIVQRIVLISFLWACMSIHPTIHLQITTNDNQIITLDAEHPIVRSSSTLQDISAEIYNSEADIVIPLTLDVSANALGQFIAFVTRPEHAPLLIDLTTSSSSSWQDAAKKKHARDEMAYTTALQIFQQRQTSPEEIALPMAKSLLHNLIYIADHLALDGIKHLLEFEAMHQLTNAEALEKFLHNDSEHAALRTQLATHTSGIAQKICNFGEPQDFMHLELITDEPKRRSKYLATNENTQKTNRQRISPIFLSTYEKRMALFHLYPYDGKSAALEFCVFNSNNNYWPSTHLFLLGSDKMSLEKGLFLDDDKRFLLCTIEDTSSERLKKTTSQFFLFEQNDDGDFELNIARLIMPFPIFIRHTQTIATNHDGSVILVQPLKNACSIIVCILDSEAKKWNVFGQKHLNFNANKLSIDYSGNWVAIDQQGEMKLFELDRQNGTLLPHTQSFGAGSLDYYFSQTEQIMAIRDINSTWNIYAYNKALAEWELSSTIPSHLENIHINHDNSQIALSSSSDTSSIFTEIYRKNIDPDGITVWEKITTINNYHPCFSPSGKMFAGSKNTDHRIGARKKARLHIGCLNDHTSNLQELSFPLKHKIATVVAINDIGTIVIKSDKDNLIEGYQLRPFTSENVGCPSLDQALLLALAGNYRAQGKKLNLSDHLVEILESFEDNARDYLINKTNLVLPPLDSWRESSCSTSTAIKNSLHVLTDIVRK